MRNQEIKTTFTCDQCGKSEQHQSTSTYTPPGWYKRPKLYVDDKYLGIIEYDLCSIDCFVAATRKFLENQ